MEEIGGTIDGVLSGLSDIPFGPDYDPAVQLDEAVAGVRAGLEPLAGDLESIAGELDDLTSGSDDLRGQLDDLTADVTATREALDGSAVLLDQYRASAAEALELAQASRRRPRHRPDPVTGDGDRARVGDRPRAGRPRLDRPRTARRRTGPPRHCHQSHNNL